MTRYSIARVDNAMSWLLAGLAGLTMGEIRRLAPLLPVLLIRAGDCVASDNVVGPPKAPPDRGELRGHPENPRAI
jgi:hypothetical protein